MAKKRKHEISSWQSHRAIILINDHCWSSQGLHSHDSFPVQTCSQPLESSLPRSACPFLSAPSVTLLPSPLPRPHYGLWACLFLSAPTSPAWSNEMIFSLLWTYSLLIWAHRWHTGTNYRSLAHHLVILNDLWKQNKHGLIFMSGFDSTQLQIVIKLVLNRKWGKSEIKVTERWSGTYRLPMSFCISPTTCSSKILAKSGYIT